MRRPASVSSTGFSGFPAHTISCTIAGRNQTTKSGAPIATRIDNIPHAESPNSVAPGQRAASRSVANTCSR